MFNIGGGEFLVIALIALIVLGPQRLPDAARQVGKAMGELRRLSTGFQNELKDALAESDQPVTRGPSRAALTAVPDPDPTVGAAVQSVSGQRSARRTPLKAAPPGEQPASRSSGAPSGAPRRARALRAAPPDTKGS
ncbi:MAG: Sec-independent protein translocase protein TatB [Actinomycetota bacterium]